MFKIAFLLAMLSISAMAVADCDISESLSNKLCSIDYFTAKNSRQLYEYLQYGKFKDGKLLNLEIGFDLKDKEINIGTSCDLRLKFDADLRASQNGICLQAKNIFIRKQSNLIADKKAPINLIANDSIKIRRTNIQTSGDVNISTKFFNPFSNEILISRNSQVLSRKLNINTPSSLIMNNDSRIKSSIIILNGGNCEIGDYDDQVNDDYRDRERQCRKFKPKFTYSGTCLSNPIPTTLKISSVASKEDSLMLTYSVVGAPANTNLKWKFDDEFENSSSSAIQSFLFPGKHLAEAVISNSNGYFRKLGSYNNVSPAKYNKGQIAIFQFNGLKNSPSKVMAMMGVKKFNLSRSEQDPQIYTGEIPTDSAGIKLIKIPEFGYKGNFNLIVLPEISNPDQFINEYFNSVLVTMGEIDTTSSYSDFLDRFIGSFKSYTKNLSSSEKLILAKSIQANSINIYLMSAFNNKNVSKKYMSYVLSFFVPNANADEENGNINDKNTSVKMLKMATAVGTIMGGFSSIAYGGTLLESKNKIKQLAGYALIAVGTVSALYGSAHIKDILNYVYSLDSKSILGLFMEELNAEEIGVLKLKGVFNPLTPTNAYSKLYKDTIQYQDQYNKAAVAFNKSVSGINKALSFLGMPANILEIDPMVFPSTSRTGKISTDYINKNEIKVVKSETGNVTISDISKYDDRVSLKIHSPRSQNITVQLHYFNPDLEIDEYVNINTKIFVKPKVVINYTNDNLVVNFDSTDPQNPDISDLTYSWDFGDGQTFSSQSKAFTHTYSQPGTYNVSLTVTDQYGASAETTVIVEIQNDLKAVINYTKYSFTVGFDSTDPENPNLTGLNYRWDFGDGQILSTKSKYITHKYTQSGTYNVTLVVSDSNGSSAETEVIVQVQNTCRMVDVNICIGISDLSDVTFAIPGVETFTFVKGGPWCHKVSLQLKNYYYTPISSSSDLFRSIIDPIPSGYSSYYYNVVKNADGTYILIQDLRGKMYEGCE